MNVYTSCLMVPFTQDQVDDWLFFQELEQERKVYDWEAPFPMTQRTQADMAENEERIVREGIRRFARFMTSDSFLLGSEPF